MKNKKTVRLNFNVSERLRSTMGQEHINGLRDLSFSVFVVWPAQSAKLVHCLQLITQKHTICHIHVSEFFYVE